MYVVLTYYLLILITADTTGDE